MLSAQCPHCQRTVKIQERLVGKRVACPKCKGVFRVSGPDEADDGPDRPPVSASHYEPDDEPQRSSAPLAIAIISAVVVAGGLVLIFTLASRGKNNSHSANPPRPEARRLNDQPARAASYDDQETVPNAIGAAMGGLLCFTVLIVWPILWIGSLIWVAIDARNRGEDNSVVWMIVVFFTGILGLIVYLLARRPGTLTTCPNCQNRRLAYATVCPHCGVRQRVPRPED
ncbi:MAG TPA: PLDc N-terminal domain-containing protein [Gemmataceae bacterium]|jgi:hypothetical protein